MYRILGSTLLLASMAIPLAGCQRETELQGAAAVPAASAPAAPNPAQPAGVTTSQKTEPAMQTPTGGDMRALAQRSGCFACHKIDQKLVGPAWLDVATKYRGQKDAESRLVMKVAKGGGGVWGGTPMPPNEPRVNEADIQALVRFILSLK